MRSSDLVIVVVICTAIGIAGCNPVESKKTAETSDLRQNSNGNESNDASETQTAMITTLLCEIFVLQQCYCRGLFGVVRMDSLSKTEQSVIQTLRAISNSQQDMANIKISPPTVVGGKVCTQI